MQNNTRKTTESITHGILDKTYQENSTKHHKPDTRKKTIPGKQYKTSQAEYQTKQYQENSTKQYKPNTRQNSTRKTVPNIASRILDKTIPGKRYKTLQAEYQTK